MIALLQGLPLVILPNGHAFSFQKPWIKKALETTASRHGYGCWWFSRELAESIELYLRREWNDNIITIAQLESIIKDLLLSLRFSDLATAFILPPPPTTLSLVELAKEAGEGYELLFFQLLKQRLEKIATSSSEELKIYGLEASLRYLFHRKRLGREETKRQIVSYIRNLSSSSVRANSSRALEVTIV